MADSEIFSGISTNRSITIPSHHFSLKSYSWKQGGGVFPGRKNQVQFREHGPPSAVNYKHSKKLDYFQAVLDPPLYQSSLYSQGQQGNSSFKVYAETRTCGSLSLCAPTRIALDRNDNADYKRFATGAASERRNDFEQVHFLIYLELIHQDGPFWNFQFSSNSSSNNRTLSRGASPGKLWVQIWTGNLVPSFAKHDLDYPVGNYFQLGIFLVHIHFKFAIEYYFCNHNTNFS